MLLFPNAKINIGLRVLRKRADGYHDISTVMYPVKQLVDAVEFVAGGGADAFSLSGIAVPGKTEDNICLKALALFRTRFDIPPLKVYLHKAIPMGAGLGGGSADGVALLAGLNAHFKAGLDHDGLEKMAAELGSDCAFFVQNRPAHATGRGELLSPVELDLTGRYIAIVHPGIHLSTPAAYAAIVPNESDIHLAEVIAATPPESWKDLVHNDFEGYAFAKHPEIKALRDQMYSLGAVYAAMTGSGSAVYGIFNSIPKAEKLSHFGQPFVHVSAL